MHNPSCVFRGAWSARPPNRVIFCRSCARMSGATRRSAAIIFSATMSLGCFYMRALALVSTCTGLIYAKWLRKELMSTNIPGNIKGGTDGSPRNGCIAHITAHLQHFCVLRNNSHGHCVNPVHKVMQPRVTKKKGEGGCVQHRYCIGFHRIGPKSGMPPVAHPHHNITPNNATPQFAELQCPLVCNRQPDGLVRLACTSLRPSTRMTAMVLSPLETAPCGNTMRHIPNHI